MSAVPQANLLKAIATRRTIYQLKPELPSSVTIADIQATIQEIIKETPSAFNSQPSRALILTGETHKKVWDHVTKSMPNDDARKRPQSVRDEAYGSVIFFTDDKTTEKLKADFPNWAPAFDIFAAHNSGAAQILSWIALENLGLGAHLQHYNELVEAALQEKIPSNWSIVAQLCFGKPAGPAHEKTYIDNEVKVFN